MNITNIALGVTLLALSGGLVVSLNHGMNLQAEIEQLKTQKIEYIKATPQIYKWAKAKRGYRSHINKPLKISRTRRWSRGYRSKSGKRRWVSPPHRFGKPSVPSCVCKCI